MYIQYDMNLLQLKIGERAVVDTVGTEHSLRVRLGALNIREGSCVRVLHIAPFGGGILLNAEGIRVAVRRSIAQKIQVHAEELL